jgi:hypothetical protein
MRLALLFIGLFCSLLCHSQLPTVSFDREIKDSFSFISHLPSKAKFVLVYSEESYWWSNTDNYRLLSFDSTSWTAWTYKHRWKSSSERLSKGNPKRPKYYKKVGAISNEAVRELLDSFEMLKFWQLNQDSLNAIRDTKISDDVDYVFRAETEQGQKVISTYAPEYYIKLFPDMVQRNTFLTARKFFFDWWNKQFR